MSFTINDDVTLTSSASIDNVRISGNTISSTNTDGNIVLAPNGAGTVRTDNLQLDGNTISSTNTNGHIVLAPNGSGTVRTDNLQFDGNTISSTDTDGNIVLAPNGAGTVRTDNLQFDGNTISSTITNGNIVLAPEGSGGNVGISTTNPSTKLHIVNNDAHTTDTFTIETTGDEYDQNNYYRMLNSGITITNNNILPDPSFLNDPYAFNVYHGTKLLKFNAYCYAGIIENVLTITAHPEWVTTYDGGYSMIFSTKQFAFGSLTEKMRIQSDGKVRIGPKPSGNNYIYDSYLLTVSGSVGATAFTTTSDDRIKEQEEIVNSGLEVCKKLRPQVYLKKDTIDSTDTSLWKKETGFIAQEVYYDIPELRHLVTVDEKVKPAENITTSNDPSIDPDYSSWGKTEAGLNYIQIIPYTVSAIQEIDTRQTMDNERILELENENATLQSEINRLKQQMAMVMEKLGL